MVHPVPARARTRIDQRHGTLGVWRRALLMVIIAVTALALPAIGAGSVVSAEETTTTESTTTTTTEAPTTTESTTTTTEAPTTTESTTTTTTQTQQGGGGQQVPVPTTVGPSSTTSSTTSSTSSTSSTTSTTAVKSGVIVPGSKGSKSGGLSTGFKVLLVVIGLVAVAAGFMALSVIYWRHTRPALASGVDAGAADLA